MISELPDRGRAERIVVSLGPGSFTGVRIGLAAARALGLAWGAAVLGYPTLGLVAAMARQTHPGPVTVCMAGGHGEWFVQDFGADGVPEGAVQSLKPQDAASRRNLPVLAGSKADALAVQTGAGVLALDLLPDARELMHMPDALFTPALSPLYGRPPDARLPEFAR
jgi:tRNA threonylcarbamoyladenosine biosynthesis protein TsaB